MDPRTSSVCKLGVKRDWVLSCSSSSAFLQGQQCHSSENPPPPGAPATLTDVEKATAAFLKALQVMAESHRGLSSQEQSRAGEGLSLELTKGGDRSGRGLTAGARAGTSSALSLSGGRATAPLCLSTCPSCVCLLLGTALVLQCALCASLRSASGRHSTAFHSPSSHAQGC
jgi:hypothetical protein